MNMRLAALMTGLAALFAAIIFSLTVLWVDSVVADDAAQRAHAANVKKMAEFQSKVWIAGVMFEPAYDAAVEQMARANVPTRKFVAFIPAVMLYGVTLALIGTICFYWERLLPSPAAEIARFRRHRSRTVRAYR